jgi:putative spermidine/putrescine transport system substrate-binding protein
MVIPSTVDAERKSVILDMIAFALKPEQQALTIETGGMYPGPAVKNVQITSAPKNILDPILKYKRTEVDASFKSSKIMSPLRSQELLSAFEKWDRDVAGQVIQ